MLIVKSRNVVIPSDVIQAQIHIDDAGKIVAIEPYDSPSPAGRVVDAGNAVIMPGIVDTHAHINDPGRAEWEGFETATQAAAAGGVTTVVDMPLNSIPPTTTLAGLEAKLKAAQGHCWIDYGFWGGIIPGNEGELEKLAEAGALGFKAFMIQSGVDEFPMVTDKDLARAMPILARLGVPLLAHAELEGPAAAVSDGPTSYKAYLASRPRAWENRAIRRLIELAEEHECHTHIVHLSSSDALPDLAKARRKNLPITVETCPHYLTLASEEIPDGATQFKCAPPIRERGNRETLWEGLQAGVIDFVVSDHSPCLPALKKLETGDFAAAWGGIASLQFTLPLVWTEAKRRGFALEDLAWWLCSGPAAFAGLAHQKGVITEGMDADLCIWNPEESFKIEESDIRFRHHVTPYLGREVQGKVIATFVRGQNVYDRGNLSKKAVGRQVFREKETPQ